MVRRWDASSAARPTHNSLNIILRVVQNNLSLTVLFRKKIILSSFFLCFAGRHRNTKCFPAGWLAGSRDGTKQSRHGTESAGKAGAPDVHGGPPGAAQGQGRGAAEPDAEPRGDGGRQPGFLAPPQHRRKGQ